ncbi:MAG: iron-sulfur cluster assembly protein [bacterium]
MPEETLKTETIYTALKEVYDPEIPVNVVDLGLIYRVEIKAAGKVEVDMTLTMQGCPLAAYLQEQITDAVKAVPGVKEALVTLVWEPQWTPERMTTDGKKKLGME